VTANTSIPALFRAIQDALTCVYDVELDAAVEHFLCDEQTVAMTLQHLPHREALVVAEDDAGVFIGLYVAPELIQKAIGPNRGERDWLDAVCVTLEGVSHFVFLMYRARAQDSVSLLELEVQAEVDKYVLHLILRSIASDPEVVHSLAHAVDEQLWARINSPSAFKQEVLSHSQWLRRVLFSQVVYCHQEQHEHKVRYQLANALAARYTQRLERLYLHRRTDFIGLRNDLRRFYRLDLRSKLAIADAA